MCDSVRIPRAYSGSWLRSRMSQSTSSSMMKAEARLFSMILHGTVGELKW